jgi:hypothetical protein
MYLINQSYSFPSEYTLVTTVLHCTGFIRKKNVFQSLILLMILKVGLFHSPMSVAAPS